MSRLATAACLAACLAPLAWPHGAQAASTVATGPEPQGAGSIHMRGAGPAAGGHVVLLGSEQSLLGSEKSLLGHEVTWLSFVKGGAAVLFFPFMLWVSISETLSLPFIVVGYMMASSSMNVANKLAATSFEATCLLVIFQMVMSDIMGLCLQFRDIKMGTWKDLAMYSVVPIFFAGMLTTSMYGFKLTTMSTVLIIRNVLPAMTLAIEKPLLGEPKFVTWRMLMSLALVIVGSVIYGFSDVSVTKLVALILLANCILTVIERLLSRYLLAKPDFSLSPATCSMLNNTVGIVPMLVFAMILSEIPIWGATVAGAEWATWFWVLVSGLLGFCISMIGIRLQKQVTATTFLMIQTVNKIIVVGLDMLILGKRFTVISCIGVVICLGAGLWYGWEQMQAKKAADEAKKSEDAAGESTRLADQAQESKQYSVPRGR